MMKIRIGTRGSDLALWQANHVKNLLEAKGCSVTISIISTKGDQVQDLSFDKIEGKGFFTKEIESSLLHNEIDLAVHSHKDLETTEPDGLYTAAVSFREDPCELLLINNVSWNKGEIWELKKHSIIGTSSARRKSQVLALRPDLVIKDLRGNVPSRVEKLKAGAYDAILLAYAGIVRLSLDLSGLKLVKLDPEEFVPAPAQGVLALQIRRNHYELADLLSQINNPNVAQQIEVERNVLKNMNGGCHLPLGVYNDGQFVHVSYAQKSSEPSRYFRFRYTESSDMTGLIIRQLNTCV
ncbi:MAG: hydroxymethylbilane synthase [Bacteroidetes bacterium]|nr:hydroxymethylbilane synthase [Bacteroidota bacterium]